MTEFIDHDRQNRDIRFLNAFDLNGRYYYIIDCCAVHVQLNVKGVMVIIPELNYF